MSRMSVRLIQVRVLMLILILQDLDSTEPGRLGVSGSVGE